MKRVLQVLVDWAVAVSGRGRSLIRSSQNETQLMLTRIAEEGYETASDILFPEKEASEIKLHYGPVLPS